MLPKLIKDAVVTIDGIGYAGKGTVKFPELSRKMEEHRSGGMSGAIEIDLGQEKLEMEITLDGHDSDVLKLYGVYGVSGVGFRINASVEMDDLNGTNSALELTGRGRFSKIDMGEKKPGEKDTTSLTVALASLRVTENFEVLLEIDNANSIFTVNGKDMLEDRRRNLKL